jgi:hypothetical protein
VGVGDFDGVGVGDFEAEGLGEAECVGAAVVGTTDGTGTGTTAGADAEGVRSGAFVAAAFVGVLLDLVAEGEDVAGGGPVCVEV